MISDPLHILPPSGKARFRGLLLQTDHIQKLIYSDGHPTSKQGQINSIAIASWAKVSMLLLLLFIYSFIFHYLTIVAQRNHISF